MYMYNLDFLVSSNGFHSSFSFYSSMTFINQGMDQREVVCPTGKDEALSAQERLGCGNDSYGNSQYICLPNKEKTQLVETCFDGIIGMNEKGNCLELSEGKIILHSCRNFLWGCPNEDYKSNKFFEYPACFTINKKLNCYTLDPNCQSSAESALKKDTFDEKPMMILALVLVGVVLFIIFLAYLWKILRRRYMAAPMGQNGGEEGGEGFMAAPMGQNGGEGGEALMAAPMGQNGGQGGEGYMAAPMGQNGGEEEGEALMAALMGQSDGEGGEGFMAAPMGQNSGEGGGSYMAAPMGQNGGEEEGEAEAAL